MKPTMKIAPDSRSAQILEALKPARQRLRIALRRFVDDLQAAGIYVPPRNMLFEGDYDVMILEDLKTVVNGKHHRAAKV